MMKDLKKCIMPIIFILLPVAYGLLIYDKLPSMMPIHFNYQGAADGFATKNFALFFTPAVFIVLIILLPIIIKADPKYQSGKNMVLDVAIYMLALICAFLSAAMIAVSLGVDIDVNFIMNMLMGAMLMAIGNYLPKTNLSYMVGIRLPWTLNSEENWKRTHRFAGFIWVLAGIMMIVNALTINFGLAIIVIVSIAIIVPGVYSYLLYRKGI